MGHSKNRGRRRLTLPLPLRAKMIGLAMFVGGFHGPYHQRPAPTSPTVSLSAPHSVAEGETATVTRS